MVVVGSGDVENYNPATNIEIVEIYDSREESWRIAGHLPKHVRIKCGSEIVFCGGFFYVSAVNRQHPRAEGVVGFSLQDGNSFFVPLPELPELADYREVRPCLFVCGSRLLMAGFVVQPGLAKREVIIWEIQKMGAVGSSSSTAWKEITRIPPHLLKDFKTSLLSIKLLEFKGVGNYVCIRASDADLQVLTYNLTDNSWNWLPTCPMIQYFQKTRAKTYCPLVTEMYSFEPRLDMKLG